MPTIASSFTRGDYPDVIASYLNDEEDRGDTAIHMIKGRSAPSNWPVSLNPDLSTSGAYLKHHAAKTIRFTGPPKPRTCWARLDTLDIAEGPCPP